MYRLLRIIVDNDRPTEERIVAVVHLLELAKQNIMTLSQQDILPIFAMLAGFRFAAADKSLGEIVEAHFWRLVDAWHERNVTQRDERRDARQFAAGMCAAGITDKSNAINAVRRRFNLSNSVCKEIVEEAANAN